MRDETVDKCGEAGATRPATFMNYKQWQERSDRAQSLLYKSPEERLSFIYDLLAEPRQTADTNLTQALWELIDILKEQGVFKEKVAQDS